MKIKTTELIDRGLDWAVSTIEGTEQLWREHRPIRYSTDWSHGGPIGEREGMWTKYGPSTGWEAIHGFFLFPKIVNGFGPTELVAKMRCHVASKLGDVVDVPDWVLA